MSDIDIVERLENLTRPGGGILLDTTGHESIGMAHAEALHKLCIDALAEIKRLRLQVFGQGARLDQLHSIVGAAMAEPLVSFAEIKKEIRNG